MRARVRVRVRVRVRARVRVRVRVRVRARVRMEQGRTVASSSGSGFFRAGVRGWAFGWYQLGYDLLRLYGLFPGRRLIRMLGANVRESNQFSVVGGGRSAP